MYGNVLKLWKYMWFTPGLADSVEVKLNVRSFGPISEFTRSQQTLYVGKHREAFFLYNIRVIMDLF